MIKPFSTRVNAGGVNTWLLLARLSIGVFMLTHGIPKLQNLVAGNMKFADPIGIGALPSFLLVVFAEVICSVLLMLGLATRFACVPLLINMSVAAFIVHTHDAFGKKELALLYLVFYLGFLILGPGKYSIDHLIGGKSKSRY
jgi:putative oxidoreductase